MSGNSKQPRAPGKVVPIHSLADALRQHARGFAWVGLGLLLLLAPLVFTSSLGHALLSQIGIAMIVCLSYNLLLGEGGMLSFGHAVYSGMGTFLAIHTLKLVGGGLPLPVSLVPLAGGLAALLLAALLGWVTTRKSATPFAMITLGVGELVWAASLMFPEFFGGEGGVSANRVAGTRPFGVSYGPQIHLYYLIAIYTLVCAGLMAAFTHTPLGQMLNAVRDNPERAGFVGYDAQKVRYIAFVIAAFFAGVSGGLAALHFEIATSEVFGSHRSGNYLLFTVLGGTTFFFGPIIGAVLMVLANVFASELTRAWLLYLGFAFLLVVMLAPGGLASLLVRGLHLARAGKPLALALAGVGLSVTLLIALGGAAAMVEMLYHQQLGSALGTRLQFMGLTLDADDTRSWLAAASVLLLGVVSFEATRRRVVRRWRAMAPRTASADGRGRVE